MSMISRGRGEGILERRVVRARVRECASHQSLHHNAKWPCVAAAGVVCPTAAAVGACAMGV